MYIFSMEMRGAHVAAVLLVKNKIKNRPSAAEFSGGKERGYFETYITKVPSTVSIK